MLICRLFVQLLRLKKTKQKFWLKSLSKVTLLVYDLYSYVVKKDIKKNSVGCDIHESNLNIQSFDFQITFFHNINED